MNLKLAIKSLLIGTGVLATNLVAASNTTTTPSFSSDENDLFQKLESVKPGNTFLLDGREFKYLDDMLIKEQPKASVKMQRMVSLNDNKWTDGNVIYEFAPSVTQANREHFVEATKVWADIADITFIERTNQTNYIYVNNSTENSATLGMVGGKQFLNMVSWGSKEVIIHELGHSLGMSHEHQRSDRDNYIDILTDNIKPDKLFVFEKNTISNHGAYDFMSVMHYSLNAFSLNGQATIHPKPEYDELAKKVAGRHLYISGGDQFEMATQYGKKDLVFPDAALNDFLVNNFDTNNDGKIDSLEALNVTEIHTPGNGEIKSLKGLEYFGRLNILDASHEAISSFDILPLSLKALDLSHNNLTAVSGKYYAMQLMENLNISHNPIDEYSCESILALNTKFGVAQMTYSPLKNDAPLVCDVQSKWILLSGKPKSNVFALDSYVNYVIDVTEGSTHLNIKTTYLSDAPQFGAMNLYTSVDQIPTPTNFDYASTNLGNEESVTVLNPQAGRWTIKLVPGTAPDNFFGNISIEATISNQDSDLVMLDSERAITGLSAVAGEVLTSFMTHNGIGNADMYANFDREPTLTNYDCRPWVNGNTEQCYFNAPQVGRYYVHVVANTDFSDLDLVANFKTNAEIDNMCSIFGATYDGDIQSRQAVCVPDNQKVSYWFFVPEGSTSVSINTKHGTGNGNLYYHPTTWASTEQHTQASQNTDNNEALVISNPSSGYHFITVDGTQSNMSLKINIQ